MYDEEEKRNARLKTVNTCSINEIGMKKEMTCQTEDSFSSCIQKPKKTSEKFFSGLED